MGLVIGKNGETVRGIHQKTGCFIFIPKESKTGDEYRELDLSGSEEAINSCILEIEGLINNVS